MKKLIMMLTVVFILVIGKSESYAYDFTLYNSFLAEFVVDGLVDYKSMKKKSEAWNKFLQNIEQLNPNEFKKYSTDEQLAFWINAYNAITLEAILRNYPIQWGSLVSRARFPKSSIRQINKVWDTVYIKVMGKELTLNQIEHEILRKQFPDPRIHFVIVCASIGCPKLENRAFNASNLDQRLEWATRNFISDPKQVRLDKEKNTLFVSSIFNWYKIDFVLSSVADQDFKGFRKSEKGMIEFIVRRLSQDDRDFIIKNKPKIKYLKYDWTLNEQK